jgi:hypothetical protein
MFKKNTSVISPILRGVIITLGVITVLVMAVNYYYREIIMFPRIDANINLVDELILIAQENPNNISTDELDSSFQQFLVDFPDCLIVLQREINIEGNDYAFTAGDSGKVKGIRKYFIDDSYVWVHFENEVVIQFHIYQGDLVGCEVISFIGQN